MMDFPEVHKIAQGIAGWFFPAEGKKLYEYAVQCQHPIVEIGTYQGRSTTYLAFGSKAGNHVPVYTIDPHLFEASNIHYANKISVFNAFKETMRRFELFDVVSPIITTSEFASIILDVNPELIFIDGDHTYLGVKLDFDCWYPKLLQRGIMAMHDYIRGVGPSKLVGERFTSEFFTSTTYIDMTVFGVKK